MCPTLNSTTTSTTAAEPPTLKGKWARTVKTTAAPGVCVYYVCPAIVNDFVSRDDDVNGPNKADHV